MGSSSLIFLTALALSGYLIWSLKSGRVILRGTPLWTYRSKDPFSYWTGIAVLATLILILFLAAFRTQP